MFNKRYNEILRQHEDAWTLSYLFPERYRGAKIPDEHPVPSNTMTIDMDRTVKGNNGNYLGFFSPIIETCAPYFNSYEFSTSLPTGGLGEYIVYADNNSEGINIDSNNILENLSTWGYHQGPNYQKLSAYKRIRVVGACIEVKVVDREKDYSGLIETCLGFEVIGNGLKNDQIDINKLSNYPHYRNFKANQEIIMKYRYNNEKYIKYGPYEPFSTVPFHVIKISGLSASASIRVKTTIHIEGMLMPSLVHFATKDIIQQSTISAQQEKQKENVSETTMSKDDSEARHDNFSSQYSYSYPDMPDNNTRVPKKKKKKSVEPELLHKRNDYKTIDDWPKTLDEVKKDIPTQQQNSLFGSIFSTITAGDILNIFASKNNSQDPQIQYEHDGKFKINNEPEHGTAYDLPQSENIRIPIKSKEDSAIPLYPSEPVRRSIKSQNDSAIPLRPLDTIKEPSTLNNGTGYEPKMTDSFDLNIDKKGKKPNPKSLQMLNAFISRNPGVLSDEQIEGYKEEAPEKLFEFERQFYMDQRKTKRDMANENMREIEMNDQMTVGGDM